MRLDRKNPEADLRKYYQVFLQGSLVVVLLVFFAATKIDFRGEKENLDLTTEQEVVKMEEIVQTKHIEKPPPPPRPPVPVEVPNDEIVEDQVLDINAELQLDSKLEMPAPPSESTEEEEDFFVVVEQMPELKGGLASIQKCVNYPKTAQRAGIEGRVIVQFIVNENGTVDDPQIVRGIGAGADEEAIRCVKNAEFVPGQQRGNPVRVQFSVPVIYNLTSKL
ncbi:energy transducer TonB [Aliifodinibius sp. S!AR15-10]|uniref:energy transducer TonB n=1 Tax=Aliifodinibius sp. S!AR15-10 TaxID=2950437 RepID=UPI00285A2C9E|nr:energy transducer TonB [Aliifodinibius sp. S!AR15-10]MDR8392079.1 energy transducer TonB [Aliifodinibius sp. S!AR15-10]